jgi:hypothetical protein
MDLIIKIPDDKKDYIIEGICLNHKYENIIGNPDFNPGEPIDPITNPVNLPNPETKGEYAKKAVILMMKNSVIDGYVFAQVAIEKTAVDAVDLEQ